MLVLNREDIRAALSMADAIDALEGAFRALAEGTVMTPPRITFGVMHPDDLVLVMPAYLSGVGALGLKLVTSYPENPKKFHAPNVHATILYCDHTTGERLALMEGAHLTAVRTGATSALATKYLARDGCQVVGIIGSGVQAKAQLEAMCAVRPIVRARVYSPTPSHAASFADTMAPRLNIEVEPVGDPRRAVEGCDIVVAATSATAPVFNGAWLSPGTHINGIGSHTPDAREVDDVTVKRAKVVVESLEAVLREAGDLVIPMAAGVIPKDHVYAELGEMVIRRKPGRTSEGEVTFFKSVGLAIEDISTAKRVYERARALGIGREVIL